MIIGETFNQYNGNEDSYDYLFKKKSGSTPTPRQQKKAERKTGKANGPNKPAARFMQKRQDKKAGIGPKKKLIMGNFGLFNKNKKKEDAAQAAATATPDVTAQTDTDNSQDAGAVENPAQNQSQEMNPGTDNSSENNVADNQDNTPSEPAPDSSESDPSESGYDDTPAAPKSENKAPAKDKKKTSVGEWIGWGCLGVTVFLIGYTMYRLDKMEAKLPHNNELSLNN